MEAELNGLYIKRQRLIGKGLVLDQLLRMERRKHSAGKVNRYEEMKQEKQENLASIVDANAEIARMNGNVNRLTADVHSKAKELNDDHKLRWLAEDYKRANRYGEKVTDHAVCRWLERVHGVDINSIKDEVYKVAKAGVWDGKFDVHGARRFVTEDADFLFHAVDDRLLTIITKTEKDQ